MIDSFVDEIGKVFLDKALMKDKTILPEEFSEGLFCENYEYRCEASARTWTRPHAMDNLMYNTFFELGIQLCFRDIVPLNQVKSNFNFKTDMKRVLNFKNVVTDEDNIKQDISIDVYGRQEKTEKETAEAEEAAKPVEETPTPVEDDASEEDDLESFLAA